ncbi:MAG: hypothetical protein RLY78_3092 [Pseudomonadota bacterium]|jgi:hypothetical protein|uniref:DUF3429 domain-containing protein n=1 Tax=Pseudaquabacterium rugosum TaxID=2984194 RepID=A0ABU9B6J3_9BURK
MSSSVAEFHPPLTDTARQLGLAGLVPFVIGALLIWVVDERAHPYATHLLSAYGGVIVSFLGGIYWGLGLRMQAPPAFVFVWGVVPSLVAWVGVMMPPSAGLALLGFMLVICYLVDRRHYPVLGIGHWLTLRFRLTAVAAFSCFLGAAGT